MTWFLPALLISFGLAALLVGFGLGPFERSGRLSLIAPLVGCGLALLPLYFAARA